MTCMYMYPVHVLVCTLRPPLTHETKWIIGMCFTGNADEASRYMQMMFKASKDIVEDAQTGHKRNYDDIPL